MHTGLVWKRCLKSIKSSNLPVETLHPYKISCRPWVKVGMDFFQDHFGKKHLIIADYFSKLPICLPSGICTPSIKTINHLRELFTNEGIPTIVMCLCSMETTSNGLLKSLTLFTPHHHPTSTNSMVLLKHW